MRSSALLTLSISNPACRSASARSLLHRGCEPVEFVAQCGDIGDQTGAQRHGNPATAAGNRRSRRRCSTCPAGRCWPPGRPAGSGSDRESSTWHRTGPNGPLRREVLSPRICRRCVLTSAISTPEPTPPRNPGLLEYLGPRVTRRIDVRDIGRRHLQCGLGRIQAGDGVVQDGGDTHRAFLVSARRQSMPAGFAVHSDAGQQAAGRRFAGRKHCERPFSAHFRATTRYRRMSSDSS